MRRPALAASAASKEERPARAPYLLLRQLYFTAAGRILHRFHRSRNKGSKGRRAADRSGWLQRGREAGGQSSVHHRQCQRAANALARIQHRS